MQTKEKDLVMIALFAALIAVLGLIPKFTPISGVPITAQSLGLMLAGSVLGAKRAALAALLFLVLVALGLPLLSGGRGGIGVFASPSVGFLVAWPLAAFVTGYIVEKNREMSLLVLSGVASVVGGIVVMYIPGIIGMAVMLDKSITEAIWLGLVYIPGDLIKAIVAGIVTDALFRARPASVLSR